MKNKLLGIACCLLAAFFFAGCGGGGAATDDFNRDSFADAVLGLWSTDGRVEVFMGRSDLSGTPSENTSMGGAAHETFGSSVSGGASP